LKKLIDEKEIFSNKDVLGLVDDKFASSQNKILGMG